MHSLIVFSLEQRTDNALQVQKILTESGCIIKTRLGLHEVADNHCADSGLVVLELVGEPDEKQALLKQLSEVDGVTAKLVEV
ncbi:MAG TPA: hypothetical protein ENN77_02275 [Candidatus Wirthbacteria bacterium]|nr:hypothetical protein [Candidatus Wirthbacteria bacterium]